MKNRKKLSELLILDIFTMIILYLIPDSAGSWTVKGVAITCLAAR